MATIKGWLGPQPAPGADAWYLIWLVLAHLPGGPGCWVEDLWDHADALWRQRKRERRVATASPPVEARRKPAISSHLVRLSASMGVLAVALGGVRVAMLVIPPWTPLFVAYLISVVGLAWWEEWMHMSAPRRTVRSSPDHGTNNERTSPFREGVTVLARMSAWLLLGWALWVGAGWLGLI